MEYSERHPHSIATEQSVRIAHRGWRLPCAERGSGTVEKQSNRLIDVSDMGWSSLTGPYFTHEMYITERPCRRGPPSRFDANARLPPLHCRRAAQCAARSGKA